MSIMEINEKKIFWPFVLIMIVNNFVDGSIFMGINLILIIYFIILKKRCKIPTLNVVDIKPLILILIIGTFVGGVYISNYNIRDYIRDIYNVMQPIIFIWVGYLSYSVYKEKYCIYKTFIVVSVIMSLIYIAKIIENPLVLQSNNIVEIRESIGKELYIHILTLTLLLTKKNIFTKNFQYAFSIIIATVFIIQFSRASFGTIAIILGVYILLQRKITVRMINKFVLLLLVFIIFWELLPKDLTNDFIERILKSTTEVASKQNFASMDDIQSNWRGYENYIVMQIFDIANIFEKLFGFGFGKTAYLGGISIFLGDKYYSSISVFHNGYIQILLKCGILGILSLLWFYFSNVIKFYNIRNRYREYEYECNLIIAILISCLFLTYVKGGIFRGGSLYEMCILLGYISNKISLSINKQN